MEYFKKISIAIIISLLITACAKDDDLPIAVVEEEVITTMIVTLTPEEEGIPVELKTQDLDGDGPNPPVVTVSGSLSTNTTYNGRIELLNETESPAENITEEVEELDEDHQFFFESSNALVTFAYSDTDSNGNPVGLKFTLVTTNAGADSVTVSLIHEPVKDANGVITVE